MTTSEVTTPLNSGSRFAALDVIQETDETNENEARAMPMPSVAASPRASTLVKAKFSVPTVAQSSKQGGSNVTRKEAMRVNEVQQVAHHITKGFAPRGSEKTYNVLVLDGQKPVASKNTVINATFTLNMDKHVAVHVVEKGTNHVLRDNNGRILPSYILGFNKNTMGIKGVQHSGLKTKKCDKHGSSKEMRQTWVNKANYGYVYLVVSHKAGQG
ncbi:hypothetical protein V6N13_124759 [Hibiscus sabdariffa]|uniref:Uncharacterized protein n=1 Tax=Hibiscus sabdariffa TaxID=183260 RepID=A0ABR2U467_9ROSI